MRRFFIYISLFILLNCSLQASYVLHSLTTGLDYTEIKDEQNHGFVFNGPRLNLEYHAEFPFRDLRLDISSEYSGSVLFDDKTTGYGFDLRPIRVFAFHDFYKFSNFPVCLGLYLQNEYKFHHIKDLHTGSPIYLTNYELGFEIQFIFIVKKVVFIDSSRGLHGHFEDYYFLKFRNNIVSLSGRDESRNEYYFSNSFSGLISNIHKNLHFGSVNKILSSSLEFAFYIDNRHSLLSFYANYLNYFDSPKYREFAIGLNLRYYLN